uniref:Uncharacterized protein n=1 Tax=Plectus sambesii TaxID=2011161 RepID=A0A914UN16_9BILA
MPICKGSERPHKGGERHIVPSTNSATNSGLRRRENLCWSAPTHVYGLTLFTHRRADGRGAERDATDATDVATISTAKALVVLSQHWLRAAAAVVAVMSGGARAERTSRTGAQLLSVGFLLPARPHVDARFIAPRAVSTL